MIIGFISKKIALFCQVKTGMGHIGFDASRVDAVELECDVSRVSTGFGYMISNTKNRAWLHRMAQLIKEHGFMAATAVTAG